MTISTFADRLREARERIKLSQSNVADILGITRQAYGNYESGKREPDINTLVKLIQLFNVSSSWLLGVNEGSEIDIKESASKKLNKEEYAIFKILYDKIKSQFYPDTEFRS